MTGIGFPQLDASTYPSQLVSLGIAFVALYVLMSKLALPRVAAVLEKRRLQKDSTLEKALQTNEEADKIKTAYEKSLAQAQKTATASLISAERAVAEKIAEVQARFADTSRKRLVATEQNIVKAKNEALHSLADISAEIAAEMVHKIADIQVNKADAKKVVMSVMEKG